MSPSANRPALFDPVLRWGAVARRLISWRYVLLLVAAALTVAALPYAYRLQVDQSIENMFAPDDPVLAPYQQLKRTFGGDEIALAAYIDPQLLTARGMDRLENLTQRLAEVPGVASVFSLTRSPLLGKHVILAPWRESFYRLCEGYAIGPDRQTVGVACVLMPQEQSPVARQQTIDQLRSIVEAHDSSGVLTGEPVMVFDGFRYLSRDGYTLAYVATGLLMSVIVLSLHSIRWVFVPMAVVWMALVLTEGCVTAAGLRLTMVSSMLWAIVTVIGIATVMHLVVRYREERSAGLEPRAALTTAATMLGAPIMWACLTDAVGFGALLVSRVGPVRDFGTMMVLGSLWTLAGIALLVPGLALLGQRAVQPRRTWAERWLDRVLERVVDWIERHPRPLALACLVAALCASLGMLWLEVESDFTRNFRSASPLVRSYDFVETRLGGAGVWDVVIPRPATIDRDWFERLARLHERLRTEVVVTDTAGRPAHGLTKVLGVVDVLELLPWGKPDPARLDDTLDLLQRQMPLVGSLYGTDPRTGGKYFRIMLRAYERQSAGQKQRLIDQVRTISRQEFPQAEVTGAFVLLARLIESVSRDQWLTFAVAAAGIGLMMTVALRSLGLALVALVPGAMPIFIVMGMLGWLGLKINLGAAMIASVSMGLAVDSSIHYITAYERRRAAGDTLRDALHYTHQRVGRAMIFSTAALVAGFGALCFSRFVPTIYFGALVSLAMIGGLAGNLVLLPLLLKFTARHRLAGKGP